MHDNFYEDSFSKDLLLSFMGRLFFFNIFYCWDAGCFYFLLLAKFIDDTVNLYLLLLLLFMYLVSYLLLDIF